MSLFQKSVEKKYLNDLDSTLIDKKYADFQYYFGDSEIQENIKNSKEEQFQEGFLRELFVWILEYTLNPQPNFNLTTEFKNIVNSKKADGAILKETFQQGVATPCYEVIGVIELKGTDTTDLDKIETQAFGYKNHHPKCKYVITSNFEKLRFYIQNAVDHVDFDLFNLTREQFSLMWLCLAKDNLLNDLPLKIKESSVLQEENITKKLYADYSKFREAIYNNLVKNNIGNNNKGLQPITDEKNKRLQPLVYSSGKPFVIDKLTLFKKTQKLLDRFLFIFFAEDRLLVPPNSISQIIEKWKDDVDFGDAKPLYYTFKKYFHVLNVGRPKSGNRQEIYAYNGGLFKPDEILDNITIDDDILHEHTLRLSNYDFETDVDVNILGHIFEHSLGEIENVQAEIAATDANKGLQPLVDSKQTLVHSATVSKRKKDGIFYTPKYITKYIVENTVGKLCEEKRTELEIVDEDYAKGRKNRKKEIVRTLNKKLENYRNWLLTLTILDPACGSGAFLNQALDFLITEHRKIDDLRAQLFGSGLVFSDITADILEKNIYGVDLNDESVEIAKLSLWLRTAQKGRKLNTLSNNIKCGNSLIDDLEVVGETRGCNSLFNWQKEFPNIFQKKEKKAWHVTWVTHDTRTSARMIKYKVRERRANGEMHVDRSIYLENKDAVKVTEIISDIISEEKYNCLAYNIEEDHVHIILVCEEDELSNIVRKLKAKSAQKFKEFLGLAKDETFNLWAQKFNRKLIASEEQLLNTIEYIRTNREKHRSARNHQGFASPSPEMQERFNKGLQPLVERTSSSEAEQEFQIKMQSLIERMTCTRKHAFRTEYKGGFDVVIGNPPYVHLEKIKETSVALKNADYETYHSQGDIYCVFVEKGIDLLKSKGLISYIMPNKWLQAGYGKPLREYLLKFKMYELIDFGDIQIFDGATTYPCIFTLQKAQPQKQISISVLKESGSFDFKSNVLQNAEVFETASFSGETWVISSNKEQAFLEKLKTQFGTLSNFIGGQSFRGVLTGLTKAFLIDEETKQKIVKTDSKAIERIKPFLQGRDLTKYNTVIPSSYLILFEKGFTNKNIAEQSESENWLKANFPSIENWLAPFKDRAKKRTDKGDYWWELRACDYYQKFSEPKIMYQKFQVKPCFIYDEQGLYCNDSMWIIPTENKALLGVLNSKLGWWLITKYCTQIQNGCQLIWKYFGQIPVPELNSFELTNLVEKMIRLTQKQQIQTSAFLKYLNSQFLIEKLSRKLENWHELEFSEFIKELQKSITDTNKVRFNKMLQPLVMPTKTDEMEWMELFEIKKAEAQTLKSEIKKTDKEIDQMVYELYGLTEEEVEIVENSI